MCVCTSEIQTDHIIWARQTEFEIVNKKKKEKKKGMYTIIDFTVSIDDRIKYLIYIYIYMYISICRKRLELRHVLTELLWPIETWPSMS